MPQEQTVRVRVYRGFEISGEWGSDEMSISLFYTGPVIVDFEPYGSSIEISPPLDSSRVIEKILIRQICRDEDSRFVVELRNCPGISKNRFVLTRHVEDWGTGANHSFEYQTKDGNWKRLVEFNAGILDDAMVVDLSNPHA